MKRKEIIKRVLISIGIGGIITVLAYLIMPHYTLSDVERKKMMNICQKTVELSEEFDDLQSFKLSDYTVNIKDGNIGVTKNDVVYIEYKLIEGKIVPQKEAVYNYRILASVMAFIGSVILSFFVLNRYDSKKK